jgi:hypothetical protein
MIARMPARPYEVVLSDGRVEAWSAQRLNFEPKDWRKVAAWAADLAL